MGTETFIKCVMEIKFVLCPETVRAYGTTTLMTGEMIAAAYGVPWGMCISQEEARTIEGFRLVYLHPRYDGKYEEWLQKEIEGRNFE